LSRNIIIIGRNINAAQQTTHQSTKASKVGDDITHHTTIYLRKVAGQTESAIYECDPYGISVDFEGFNVDHLQQLLG
jgi:hypothetical protein